MPKQRSNWWRIGSSILLIFCCVALLVVARILPLAPLRLLPSGYVANKSGLQVPSNAGIASQLVSVQVLVQNMSLEQKLGQLILVEYIGNDYQRSGLAFMIREQLVGGFLYQEVNHNFEPPMHLAANVRGFSLRAMRDATIPLLIATDQEGGLVNRLYKFHGSIPSAQEMAATGDPQIALLQGSQTAKWLAELGMNANFAPVVDVQSIDPPVLATRMFGRDPQAVVNYAGAFLQGLQQHGVAGCLKHFPGLGAITSDPHHNLPIVQRSKAELDQIDLAPYKLLLKQQSPAMIMSTDVLMPAIDPLLPAELSPQAINGVLRGELGYNGVVVTDGLYMAGISNRWTLGEAAVLAIIAGNDLIEGPFTPKDVSDVVAAWKQAILDRRLSVERIDQSVQRILLLKMNYGIFGGNVESVGGG